MCVPCSAWRLIAASRVIDLSVTTGADLPCSPPEGQPPAQVFAQHLHVAARAFPRVRPGHDDHTGTHINAPAHFAPAPDTGLPHATEHGGVTIERLALEQLMGPAAVVDLRHLIEAASAGETTNPREAREGDHHREHPALRARLKSRNRVAASPQPLAISADGTAPCGQADRSSP